MRPESSALPISLNITFQFLRVFRTRTPPEGQYSYSIGWTIEYECEYHFIEYEDEICQELWVKTRPASSAGDRSLKRHEQQIQLILE